MPKVTTTRLWRGSDHGRLVKGINALGSLLTRNNVLAASGIPMFTYAEAQQVASLQALLQSIAQKRTNPL